MRSRWKSSQGGKNYIRNWGKGSSWPHLCYRQMVLAYLQFFLLEFVSNCGKEQSKWDIVSSALFSPLPNLFEIGLSFFPLWVFSFSPSPQTALVVFFPPSSLLYFFLTPVSHSAPQNHHSHPHMPHSLLPLCFLSQKLTYACSECGVPRWWLMRVLAGAKSCDECL